MTATTTSGADPDSARTWNLSVRRTAVIGAVALLVAGTLSVSTWLRPDEPPPATPPPEDPVATEAVVRRQNLHVTLHLTAQTARSEATIAAPAESVLDLVVPDGTTVTAGDPIGRVVSMAHDPVDAENAVAEAEAMLTVADLDRTKAVGDSGRVLDSAKQAIARLRARPFDDPASAEEIAAAETALQQARADLEDATERGALNVAQATDQLLRRRADFAAAEGAARSVIASATGTLRRTSPSTAAIDVGLVVRSELLSTQLLRLRSGTVTGTAIVETTGGRRQVPCIELLMSSEGTAPLPSPPPATPDEPASGGGTLDCRLTEALDTVPGLPATVTVAIDFGTDVPVVPEIAISFDDEGSPYVVTTAGEQLPVELGASDGVLRVVRGIDEGTEVVLQ